MVEDKKIQKVVVELKALPHDVLIRYLTYWSDAIESRKYVVESNLPHEERYSDCCDYAASETDEERYIHAKVIAEILDTCCKVSSVIIRNSFVKHKEYIKCADLITRSAHFAFLNFSCKLKADTQFLKAHDY